MLQRHRCAGRLHNTHRTSAAAHQRYLYHRAWEPRPIVTLPRRWLRVPLTCSRSLRQIIAMQRSWPIATPSAPPPCAPAPPRCAGPVPHGLKTGYVAYPSVGHSAPARLCPNRRNGQRLYSPGDRVGQPATPFSRANSAVRPALCAPPQHHGYALFRRPTRHQPAAPCGALAARRVGRRTHHCLSLPSR